MSQAITAEVRNADGTSFRQVIKPGSSTFDGNAAALCKDMFGDALISVNKPVAQEKIIVKKDLENIATI